MRNQEEISVMIALISSPLRSENTKTGRFLLPDRSVNGKDMIIILPFTNLPMPHPHPALPSLLTGTFHSTAWFPVFAKSCGALFMRQNLLLRRYNVLEAPQFLAAMQRGLSFCFSYNENIA
jgi:hypothetical protein